MTRIPTPHTLQKGTYRVRWVDERESIHYPSDGTRIMPAPVTA